LYSMNSFDFSGSMSQRLLGALAAIFIPLILGLGLIRSHVIATDHLVSPTILKLRFLAKSSPLESVVELKTLAKMKVIIRQRSGNLLAKEPISHNQEKSASASLTPSSSEIIETDLASQASLVIQHAEVAPGTLTQQYKGKSAIGAYHDARSDIQKMAVRKGVALQAERQTKYELFQTAASDAVIPDCVAQGTITKLGLDSFKGLLVIPALATAAAMGKCK
jgi:hypothetical protein